MAAREYRKVAGWPVTPKVQAVIGVCVAPFASFAVSAAAGHAVGDLAAGLLLALVSIVPHEYLHALSARRLGLRAEIRWSLLSPHTRPVGVLGMAGVARTNLAPQILTCAYLASAAALHAPALAVAAIAHGVVSAGDLANAAVAASLLLRPETREIVLLNVSGDEAGLCRTGMARHATALRR